MVQGMQCELVEGEGQVEVGASRLLGLEGLAVSRVDLQEGSRDRVVHMVTAADAAADCPLRVRVRAPGWRFNTQPGGG